MLDPWTYTEIEDYGRLMEEFGIETFKPEALPAGTGLPRLFKRKIVFGHRGFGQVLRRMASGGPFAVMSGLMPRDSSGPDHRRAALRKGTADVTARREGTGDFTARRRLVCASHFEL